MDIASLWSILVIAFLVQQLWQVAKSLWKDGRLQVNRAGPLVLAIILAATSGIDLFVTLGVPLRYVWLAVALTGVLCSRGAGAIYDAITKLQQLRADIAMPADLKPGGAAPSQAAAAPVTSPPAS